MGKALTVRTLEALKPGAVRKEVPDGLVRGLFFIVQPSGVQSWACRYRHEGRTRKLTLGGYPALGLTAARDLAKDALLSVARGIDPFDIKKAARTPVDRDIVELTNLQRQVLYDQADVADQTPKAIAAASRLARINSDIQIVPKVVDLTAVNVATLAGDVHLILDATDNVATRYLLNDFCVRDSRPWIYCACVGMAGRSMLIEPGRGPCLRCVFEPPAADEIETCDTAGVLGSAASVTAGLTAAKALRWIVGESIAPELIAIDVWSGRSSRLSLADARRGDCPTCALGRFDWLDAPQRNEARLCGRAAVQVQVGNASTRPLAWMAERLSAAGKVQTWPYMVRCTLREGGLTLSAFEDGRVLVQGTNDIGRARSAVERYLGS